MGVGGHNVGPCHDGAVGRLRHNMRWSRRRWMADIHYALARADVTSVQIITPVAPDLLRLLDIRIAGFC